MAEADGGIGACGKAQAGAAHADSANANAPILAALIAPTFRAWMMPSATVLQRRSPGPVPEMAACMKPGGAEAARLFAAAGYSGKGGVSPSGSGTWNTFNMFPISV